MVMNAEAQLHHEDTPTLTDFSNGSLFNEHPLFSNDPRSIQLLLYYDDVNVCNPLTNKPHKLCLFYYQLANLLPMYCSKLRSIKLFAVCSYETFQRYKDKAIMDKIFEPLVSDMQLLGRDDGYTFTITNIGQIALRGAVLAFLADTPASQSAGGFKEGVGGAKRKCRHCMATFETMQEFFEEDLFQLRDHDDHEEQLWDIENAQNKYLRQYFCKEYGINKRSALSDRPFFDVTRQLPQDIMHIFLEGILQYEIKLLLNHLIKNQVITLEELNHAIKHFPLGYSDPKNRPIIIKDSDLDMKSSTNLGQTASTMWLLSQILPFLLENYVDHMSPKWISFMTLLEIIGIAFCSELTEASVLYLKSTVKGYLTNFKTTYNVNIIPKQHYLVHLPSQMLTFGPLIRCWCMRFEGKHAYFKDLAKKIRSFKNLPFSLATRNQQMEYADFIQMGDNQTNLDTICREDIIFGQYKALQGQPAVDVKNHLLRFFGINLDLDVNSVFQCNQIEIYGTKYKPGLNNFLLFQLDDAGFPMFGCLQKIWFIEEYGCYFALNVFDTIKFDENLNAFKIEEQERACGYEVVSHTQLNDHHVYHAYKHSDERFIVTRMNFFAKFPC